MQLGVFLNASRRSCKYYSEHYNLDFSYIFVFYEHSANFCI